MTYQGERSRPMASKSGRVFEVSKIRIDPDGHVGDVQWGAQAAPERPCAA